MVETSLERLKDRELLEALALGGVKWIIVGIESLSLKLKKHGHSHLEEDLKRAVEDASSNLGIRKGAFPTRPI